jgi:molybdenum-dependent DNA-binding transcriptional regulator ModE
MSAYLSFYKDGEMFLGSSQVRLLKRVAEDGSIHAASKNLKKLKYFQLV